MEIPEQIKNKMSIEEMHISRIPVRTKRWFTEYAHEYFCGDYGLCLKHIVDNFRGMTPVGYEELQSQINQIVDRLNSQEEKEQPKGKTMADGRIRG